MAYYLDETEIYKCSQHPSKRRRSGICPVCLKLRLSALCPDCANVRPCSCSCSTSTSTSSSSSSFSLHFSGDRVSALIDGEPPFRRSSSAAFSFLRSGRFAVAGDDRKSESPENRRKSMWSVMWWRKPKREKVNTDVIKMRRSRSVAPEKGKGWYFPSPMKVFRYTKAAKLFHERSPLHRG